ncbi:MAG TPA: galactosyltransferase-related protein [Microbacterium sp.]|nr:galactosyltransferase-related protein [Microbacterium sp.]
MTRVAVITIAHGRHEHWRVQCEALARSSRLPDEYVLVTMGDPELAREARARGARVIELDTTSAELPLARARNVGAAAALSAGAHVLIFLDVDCVPGSDLVRAYTQAATDPSTKDHLLSGPVTYLDPPPDGGYDLSRLDELDRPHPDRPAPAPDENVANGSHDLFWSLSFTVAANTWMRCGGFHEGYVGYGGEDTDFAWTARARGIPMTWIGGARAYHQYHSIEAPPRRHRQAIVRNATLFHSRWGSWPMRGWLDAFVQEGLVSYTDDEGYSTAPSV